MIEQNIKEKIIHDFSEISLNGLCHRCGTCLGMCPVQAISFKAGYPEISRDRCLGCKTCLSVCPGKSFEFEKFQPPVETQNSHISLNSDLKNTHGSFLQAFLAHAENVAVRQKGASGGVITALLLALLESKVIDGAVVTVDKLSGKLSDKVTACYNSNDDKIPWKTEVIIARTETELLAAAQSKYVVTSTNTILAQLKKCEGRYAFVGLPCQIQGLKKAMQQDAALAKRISLTIGLFCHAALEPELYRHIWDIQGLNQKEIRRYIPRLGKHPGEPTLEFADGSLHPMYSSKKLNFRPNSTEMLNVFFRLYTQPRCFLCMDALAEVADISVGDPYLPSQQGVDFKDGWSFMLLRNNLASDIIKVLVDKKVLTVREVSRNEALKCNKKMARQKKYRASYLINRRKNTNNSYPIYFDELPVNTIKENFFVIFDLITHFFCFSPYGRKTVLKLFLSDVGYGLLYLNRLRREIVQKIMKK